VADDVHEINAILDSNDFTTDNNPFFDFNSAASSPKPASNSLPFNQQPHQFQSSFNNPMFQPNLSQPVNPLPNMERGRPRKRLRDEMPDDFVGDFTIDSEGTSPTVDVKMEFPPAAQPINTGFGNQQSNYTFQSLGSPQEFNPTQSFHPMFPTPLQSHSATDSNSSEIFQLKYNLEVDFPKHVVKSPNGYNVPQVKSRVETQIAVRFILSPAPDTITRLRLPRPAISKIKYIEDSHPQNNPDTLELLSTLVCSSAMAVPDQLERALCEARGVPLPEWVTKVQTEKLASDENMADASRMKDGSLSDGSQSSKEGGREERKQKVDYNKAVFGAAVQICEQCMNRERKRASRKKNKKPEEEERWAQDERLRIIVFNTNQVRQFEPLSTNAGSPASIAAETQMRICCYCRHHGEKEGFR